MTLPIASAPAQKLLRVQRNMTFDYPFQYMTSNGPIDLNGLIAYWTIAWTASQVLSTIPFAQGQVGQRDSMARTMQPGQMSNTVTGRGGTTILTNTTPAVSGQVGLVGATPGRIQGGELGIDALVVPSGVYLGANGLIDLVLASRDTSSLPWSTATYTLSITDPVSQISSPLLKGAITTFV